MLTPAQLAAHWSGIGGSMAPNVCGLGRITPYEAWLRYTDPSSRMTEETEQMEFGIEMEEGIARIAARRWGFKIRRRHITLRHKKLPFMVANVDREIVGEPAIMECKNRGFFMGRRYGDDMSEEVQPDEMIQAQHYLAVTGKARCYLAVAIGGQMLRRFVIERDDDAIAKIERIETHFWNLVQTKTAPPPATHEDCASLWPEASLDLALINAAQAELVRELAEARSELAAAKDNTERLETKVKMLIGERQGVIVNGDPRPIATWKNNEASRRFNEEALRQERPQLWEQYVEQVPGARVLRVFYKH